MKKNFIPPVLVVLSLILIIISFFTFSDLNVIPLPFNFFGIIIACSGFVIMGKSRDLFNKYKTTLSFEKPVHFINEGIFKVSRNPMYLGMFIFLLGIGISFRNLISIIVPFIFIIVIRFYFISLEEKIMKNVFGKEYIEYKRKVRR